MSPMPLPSASGVDVAAAAALEQELGVLAIFDTFSRGHQQHDHSHFEFPIYAPAAPWATCIVTIVLVCQTVSTPDSDLCVPCELASSPWQTPCRQEKLVRLHACDAPLEVCHVKSLCKIAQRPSCCDGDMSTKDDVLVLRRRHCYRHVDGGREDSDVGGLALVGQERLGPSYFFISLVLGPLHSLLGYVPSYRYIRSLAPKFCFCKNK